MFDQVNLLAQWTSKVIKQTELRAHSESAFDQTIDQKLNRLVFTYEFNFEAIALHLILQFPHFQYKITKESVAYRWYQLNLKNYSPSQTVSKGKDEEDKKCLKNSVQVLEQSSSEDSQQESPNAKKRSKQTCSNHISELQKALQSALLENNSHHQQLILYKPNYHHQTFPIDSACQGLLESQLTEPTTKEDSAQSQIEIKVSKNQQTEEYEYGYNYSQLQQQFRHYNHMIQQYGLGFHEDSLTNSSISSSEDQLITEDDKNYQKQKQNKAEQYYEQNEQKELEEEHENVNDMEYEVHKLDKN